MVLDFIIITPKTKRTSVIVSINNIIHNIVHTIFIFKRINLLSIVGLRIRFFDNIQKLFCLDGRIISII